MGFQTLTVKYDSLQDRIVVIVRVPAGDYALLLTRRLTFGLLALLARQIQQIQGDERLAQAGLQDELLSMQHVRAVTQIRTAQAGAATPNAPAPPPSSPSSHSFHSFHSQPMPERLPSHLPSRVDVTHEADPVNLIRLTFFSGAEAKELGRLIFRTNELHWFLDRLLTHAQAAAWAEEIPIPAWLLPETAEIQSASAPPSTRVH